MKTIKIKGMTCNHCVMAVTKALEKIDGVKNVKVDLAKAEATFDEVKTGRYGSRKGTHPEGRI